MNQRVRLVLIGVVALSFAAFAGAWLAAGNERLTPDPNAAWKGYLRPDGATVPAFALKNQDGETMGPATGTAIYAFVYSHCRDTCPLEVQQIRDAMDHLGHDLPVLGVSVDPANDTAASARAFMIKTQTTGRMDFLLGSREQLEPIWKAFGIRPQSKQLEHSAGIVVTTGRTQRIGFPASELTPIDLESDLRKLGA